mgnify:CR=1 FL=1
MESDRNMKIAKRHYVKESCWKEFWKPAKRKCLYCSKMFDSAGYHNRKCPACKDKEEWGRDCEKMSDRCEGAKVNLCRTRFKKDDEFDSSFWCGNAGSNNKE